MPDDDLTGDLDLLGDWLDAKGYGEEAGLCTRVMDYIHKRNARIAELEAELAARPVVAFLSDVARLAQLEEENAALKAALRQWRIVLDKDGS